MTTSEELFLQRLQQGDIDAFSTLFDEYHRLLYFLAYRYLRSQEEAEDAVQYTFMKIWEQKEHLVFTSGIKSLLFTIMKHYILNELRHRKITVEKHEDIFRHEENRTECFLPAFEQQDIHEHLQSAIASLPSQKREICHLKIDLGLSNQEIADKMNIAIPTIKSHYTQAIKLLRRMLAILATILLFLF